MPAEVESDEALDMGLEADTFTPRARSAAASGEMAWERQSPLRAPEGQGFSNYFREWWRFDYSADDQLRFDPRIR